MVKSPFSFPFRYEKIDTSQNLYYRGYITCNYYIKLVPSMDGTSITYISMKNRRKYKLKATGKDAFQKKTGIKTILLTGGSDCLIIGRKKYKNAYSNQLHAYCVYSGKPINSRIKVTNTCGVTQCVKEEHLIPCYKPTKDDIEYIRANKMMGSDYLSHVLNIPKNLFESYLQSL